MDIQLIDSYMTPMHKIDDKLFLGGLMGALDIDLLESNEINSIVRALSNLSAVKKFPEFEYHSIQIDDSIDANLSPYLLEALQFIFDAHKKAKNVLVHCAAGVSRSSSIACAYLMVKYSINYEQALGMIRKTRRCASPNESFERQLKSLDIQRLQAKLNLN